MEHKGVFRNICQGDGKGAYVVARGHSYCPYESASAPESPRTPRTSNSQFTDKDSTLYEESVYECERRCPARRAPTIVVHAIVFLAYSTLLTVLVMAAMSKPDCEQCIMYNSPAKNLVNYKLQSTSQYDLATDIYAGHPRPELEAAWSILLEPTNLRLTESEVHAVNRLDNAIALPDGGYAGSLNIFHELHCVDAIQRWLHTQLYASTYFPHLNETDRARQRFRTEQCLTSLRKAALCHADVGVVTYNWDGEAGGPRARAEYQCADMGPLLEWAEGRRVEVEGVGEGDGGYSVLGEVVTSSGEEGLRQLMQEGLGVVRKGVSIMSYHHTRHTIPARQAQKHEAGELGTMAYDEPDDIVDYGMDSEDDGASGIQYIGEVPESDIEPGHEVSHRVPSSLNQAAQLPGDWHGDDIEPTIQSIGEAPESDFELGHEESDQIISSRSPDAQGHVDWFGDDYRHQARSDPQEGYTLIGQAGPGHQETHPILSLGNPDPQGPVECRGDDHRNKDPFYQQEGYSSIGQAGPGHQETHPILPPGNQEPQSPGPGV
ncbi:hypothetical protein EJ05DRAFT_511872, partial [Pseudovirgaria hyperparasitica]